MRNSVNVGSNAFNLSVVSLLVALLVLAACASVSTSNTRSIFMDGYQGGTIEDAFVDMIRESGYVITRDRGSATHVARMYHQGQTSYCNGTRGYYTRARLVVENGFSEPLDMSSTIPCARDAIAGELELQNRVERDRRTYVQRLRAY